MLSKWTTTVFVACAAVATLFLSVSSVRAANEQSGQDVLLVVFLSPHDAASRQMESLMDELLAQQFPIVRVDVAQSPDLVARYNITTCPTLVALVNGQEVDRVVGSADPIVAKPRVIRMFEQAKNHLASLIASGKAVPTLPAAALPAMKTSSVANHRAAVRLKVSDQTGFSWGTGTIIDARQGSALVLTCGHIFRDSRGVGAIEVHLFQDERPVVVSGRCLRYNLENDLALVEVRVPGSLPVGVARVATEESRLEVGQGVSSVGCDGGDAPTIRTHRILSLNKIATPASHPRPFYYIQVSGAPVSGRSGGGLFTDDGMLVGVCNTADPRVDDGHFVPADIIRSELDAAHLTVVYREPQRLPPATLASHTAQPLPTGTVSPIIPAHFTSDSGILPTDSFRAQRSEVAFREDARELNPHDGSLVPLASVPTRALSPHERSTLQEIQRRQEAGDEVIVIVRPRGNAQAPSDVIVLQGVSEPFLSALAGAQH